MKNLYKKLTWQLDQVFSKQALYLCELDTMAGDGDHGLTISRGFHAAWDKVEPMLDDSDYGSINKAIGYAMLDHMGGASGPIFSTMFIQSSILLRDKHVLDVQTFKKIVRESIHAIEDLAETKRNEKTMVDALYGVLDALDRCESEDLETILKVACTGAKTGAEATMDMIATKGRARFLQEKSKGFLDAGSWSVYLIFQEFYNVFAEVDNA